MYSDKSLSWFFLDRFYIDIKNFNNRQKRELEISAQAMRKDCERDASCEVVIVKYGLLKMLVGGDE